MTMVMVILLAACSGASRAPSPVTQSSPTSTEATAARAVDPVALPGAPQSFVAQIGDSLARFDSTSDALLRSVTSPPKGARDDTAALLPRRIVFVWHTTGSACKSSVRWVSNNGQRAGVHVRALSV
ncbi:MAG: hypothetical protein LH630_05640 [Actinomycetia bacterium]|nr:hypothetical protein [Actinomycetes bacterium]